MALISISVIPFGAEDRRSSAIDTYMQLTDLNIGVLFILAVSLDGRLRLALAGWASNNKYSLLGGLRSSAQMISYELPMALAIAAPLLLSNTLSLREIVRGAGGLLLRLPAALDHLSVPVAADLRLHHFPDRRRSPKPTACPSICPKPKTNWSPASTPSTAA